MPDDPNSSEVNHVYVLGAGFSRPLGGPLFTDLLSLPIRYDLGKFSQHSNPRVQRFAQAVNEISVAYGVLLKEKRFLNAEHFLELCDCVLHGKESWLLQTFPAQLLWLVKWNAECQPPMSDLDLFRFILKAAKVRIAIETNSFIEQVPEMNDRWQPYSRWFLGLGSTDTIITLNYDLLVETVAAKVERPFPGRQFETNEDLISVERLIQLNEVHPDQPLLCKLHGSVDFIEVEGAAYARRFNIDDYFEGEPPLLGTPGTSKVSLSEGCLRRVWLTALERLREAHVISIVGYSMPETDNDFRIKLLDSIVGTNGNLNAINIVVGSPSPQAYRARSILEQATRLFAADDHRPTVNLLPIYAQDYLPYYNPKRISHIEKHAFPRV